MICFEGSTAVGRINVICFEGSTTVGRANVICFVGSTVVGGANVIRFEGSTTVGKANVICFKDLKSDSSPKNNLRAYLNKRGGFFYSRKRLSHQVDDFPRNDNHFIWRSTFKLFNCSFVVYYDFLDLVFG